jgi:hypothetical protein
MDQQYRDALALLFVVEIAPLDAHGRDHLSHGSSGLETVSIAETKNGQKRDRASQRGPPRPEVKTSIDSPSGVQTAMQVLWPRFPETRVSPPAGARPVVGPRVVETADPE